jgi:hypothetical protein
MIMIQRAGYMRVWTGGGRRRSPGTLVIALAVTRSGAYGLLLPVTPSVL